MGKRAPADRDPVPSPRSGHAEHTNGKVPATLIKGIIKTFRCPDIVATKLKRRASSKTGMSDGHGMSVLSYPDAAAGCSARRRPTIWSTKLFLPGDVRPFFW